MAQNPEFESLLEHIKEARGFDFTGYKRPSLTRRFDKRLSELRIPDYAAYRDYLEANPDEFVGLFDTILINVTSFFRDEESWSFLAEQVVPRLLEARAGSEPIRVWSTGCATGEEAYTLAMVLAEALGDEAFRQRVKIYATDADDGALTFGRHARYTAKQVSAVPAELRERYFEPTNGAFAFRGDLRRSVIFGRHDLVQDPPISRVDLLVSRNTLIYFNAESQHRILANFHFALRDDGVLFLGKSEALVSRSSLFAPIDIKRRVFAKVAGARATGGERRTPANGEAVLPRLASEAVLRESGFDASPVAHLIVDREGKLALVNQQARILFGLSDRDLGRSFSDLEVSFRPVELRSRIEQAYTENHAITLRDVEWGGGGESRFVDVQITPLFATTGETVGTGIAFTDVTRPRRLQDALQESKREAETAYEELQSTVEELETTNEELQSTNEELETMNEELQSTNEELETINEELHQRTNEVDAANLFLESVLGSLGSGVVVVDDELRVEAWNRVATDLWGLRREEVANRHLLNLDIGLPLDQLARPLRDVLTKGEIAEFRLPAVNRRGRTVDCHLRLAPLDGQNGVRGVILLMDAEDGSA